MLLACALASSLVAPEAETLRIEWSAPNECPNQESVRERAQIYLGEERTAVEALARVRREASHYAVDLELALGAESTHRVLEAEDCEDLADAVALLVAVTAEPVQAQATYDARVEAAAAPAPTATLVPEELPDLEEEPSDAILTDDPTAIRGSPSPVEEPRARSDGRPAWIDGPGGFAFALGFAGGAGVTPAGQLGPRIALGWRFRSLRVEALGHYWAPRPLELGGASGRVQALAGGARVCPRFFARRVELPLCAGVEGGAHVFAAEDPGVQDANGPRVAARLDFGARFPVARTVAIWLEAGTAISLLEAEFSRQNGDSWSPSPLSAEAALGIEFFFDRPNGN